MHRQGPQCIRARLEGIGRVLPPRLESARHGHHRIFFGRAFSVCSGWAKTLSSLTLEDIYAWEYAAKQVRDATQSLDETYVLTEADKTLLVLPTFVAAYKCTWDVLLKRNETKIFICPGRQRRLRLGLG